MTFSIPTDSITLGYYTEVAGVFTLLNNSDDITIVTIGMANAGQSTGMLYCGDDVIASNVKSSTGVTPVVIPCSENITFQSMSPGEASTIINYVPYDLSVTATSTYNPNLGISSTSDISLYGSMSAGDILIAFLLLMQLFLIILYLLIKSIFGVTTSKKYIQYSNGDVPINKDL